LPGALVAELQEMYNQAVQWLNKIVDQIRQAAERMVQFWKWGSGENSPGFMYDAFFGELNAMEKVASRISLPDIMHKTGVDMVSAWGNPTFTYGFETNSKGELDTSQIELTSNADIINLLKTLIDLLKSNNNGNSTFNFTLNGDVDSEERMQQFIEAVRRELNWNNATAGRDTSKYGV